MTQGTDFKARYGPAALVTGASSGIGWGFAEELGERGLDLVLTARRTDRLEELAERLRRRRGVTATVLPVDLAQRDAPQRILDATRSLDIGLVVSNAGFGFKGEHSSIDADGMADMLMVNCNAPLQLTHGFIPRLRARGRGGIVLTSSVEALIGCPNSAAYSASKALVNAFGEALWAELHGGGIDVLTLCPGATESEAAAKQGIDLATLANVMAAREVAGATLDALTEGPTFFPSAHYKATFDRLLAMPRREALLAMAAAFRP
jgi:short-subunit dehydrogenase